MKNEQLKKIISEFNLKDLNIDKIQLPDFLADDDNKFKKITPHNGIDNSNPANGRQNNYAWAMCDFNGYIYVGTGRNLPAAGMSMGINNASLPLDLIPSKFDMGAEIWRYKKDGTLPWERVYKSPVDSNGASVVVGIRSLIKFDSFKSKTAMYAGAYSIQGIKVLKSTNGVDWFEIPTGITQGTSSRNMMVYNNKLYMAVMVDGADLPSLLYSSSDPELNGWTLETPSGEEGKNPIGVVWAIKVFNKKFYLATASKEGFMLWRTNGEYPKKDDWTLVIDKGAGDTANACALSLEIFKDYLYVGTAADTTSPLSYVIPKGAELIRVDKNDNWEIVVGGHPLSPSTPSKGKRTHPLSGYMNGFNNPYNLYIWQLKVFDGKLYAGTFDTTPVIEPTLEFYIKNKDALGSFISPELVDACILLLKLQVKILANMQSLFGSDLYVSEDGINFKSVNLNGFNNRYNYGVRNIFISDDNTMYIGTANPFQGCEVYQYAAKKQTPPDAADDKVSHLENDSDNNFGHDFKHDFEDDSDNDFKHDFKHHHNTGCNHDSSKNKKDKQKKSAPKKCHCHKNKENKKY